MDINLFKESIDFNSYFVNQLTLSSTLLGLLIATSTFILQSGFASFEFSRSMFLKYYVRLSKFLFLLLAYNIFICIIFLYLQFADKIALGLHAVFSIIFLKYILDFYSHKGYIYTISSAKFNPWKNRFRKYMRYIVNLGFFQILIILIILIAVICFPVYLGDFKSFSERQGFVSTLICFSFCVVSIIRILPQFFSFSEYEYERRENNELLKQIETDVTQELVILKETLIENGRSELASRIDFDPINGEIEIRLSEKKDEAFFVINFWTKLSDVEIIVREIENYSFDFFKELNGVHVDINNFVLSYFIRIEGTDASKTYFIRSKRTELDDIFRKTSNPKEFIKEIKNKVLDELFRGV